MPAITFDALPLTKEQKKQLVQEFTDSAAKITGLPPEAFYVYIKENPADNIGVGGKLLSDKMKK